MTRFGALVDRIDVRGRGADLPLMSVSQTRGVIRRSELTPDLARAESLDDYKICRAGDIVFNKMSIRDGAMGVAPEDGLVTYHYEVMRPKPDADPRYVSYLMKSEWFKGELIKLERGIGAGGTSGVRTTEVPFSVLRTIDAPLVGFEMQRVIANHLDAETDHMDRLVGRRRRMIALMDERYQARITRLFDELPRLPLRRFMRGVEQGWSPTGGDLPRESDSQWAVLKLSAVTGGYYRPDQHKSLTEEPRDYARYEVKPGDLLMTRANTPELVGDVVYVRDTPPRLLLPDLIYRLRFDPARTSGAYLAFAMRVSEVRGQVAAIARGSSQSMVKLRGEDIGALLVPIPALSEQLRIQRAAASLTATHRAQLRAMSRQVDLILERRQALITAAVTGQLEIPGVAA